MASTAGVAEARICIRAASVSMRSSRASPSSVRCGPRCRRWSERGSWPRGVKGIVMAKKTVSEVAKEVGVERKDLVGYLEKQGKPKDSAKTTLADDEVEPAKEVL